jgi:Protein of unknown function DUF262/Restriction Enzyme Adenine Methylase Associated/Protein of unknown function (DUF1524)
VAVSQVSAQTFALKQLFEAATYDIEYYQREYAWSDEDVRILITDLYDEFDRHRQARLYQRKPANEPFFLGPFVYYEEHRGVRFLVDGQQRFTTLHLIFIHLFRMATDFHDRTTTHQLSRVISDYDDRGERFRVNIDERHEALNALYSGNAYELRPNASLSLRNLWHRSNEIADLLDERLDAESCPLFVTWLLNNVVLVGIQALSRDNGFRIFESMNDRGAQLTQVDLVKSFLLSNVGSAEEELNKQWRTMLAELTRVREDRDAPRRFLAAALVAHWAEISEDDADDEVEINQAVNGWIRKAENRHLVKLRGPGEDYFRFVKDLVGLSTHYANLLRATLQPYEINGLSAVYFNHVNGLTNQMSLILAAIQPTDTPSSANAKAALVANYLDRLFVLRALDFEPVDAKSFERDIRRLVPRLRKCETPGDVARELTEEMSTSTFHAILDFRMQGNNKAQVRYLLARLTSYAQQGNRKPDGLADYLGPARTWEIEHLWANHPEQHRAEIPDPGVFRALRSRIGALVLLPDRDNKSLNDMPFADKVRRYGRQNSLVAVLEANYRSNHPDLRDFIRANGVERYFRGFAADDTIETIVTVRAELYRLLCLRIWDPQRLGFPISPDEHTPDEAPPATTNAVKPPPAKRKRPLQTDVAKMVRTGVLPAGSQLTASYAGTDYLATINADGQVVLTNGEAFDSSDEAARTATGKRQDGLGFWLVPSRDRISLRQLRNQKV